MSELHIRKKILQISQIIKYFFVLDVTPCINSIFKSKTKRLTTSTRFYQNLKHLNYHGVSSSWNNKLHVQSIWLHRLLLSSNFYVVCSSFWAQSTLQITNLNFLLYIENWQVPTIWALTKYFVTSQTTRLTYIYDN
jgi:hypothetical protein